MTQDGQKRNQEDFLFVFLAAFYRLSSRPGDWNLLFKRTYDFIFRNSQELSKSSFLKLSTRIQYSLFLREFRKFLVAERERCWVEFALRHVSVEKMQRLAPEGIPAELLHSEEEIVDRYFTEFLEVGGDSFLRRSFLKQRSLWIRETVAKGLPMVAFFVTAVISVLALLAMRRSGAGFDSLSALGNWLEILKALF